MFSIEVKSSGTAEIARAIRAWSVAYPAGLAAALYDEGQEWADDAVPRTPRLSGFLQSTAFVSLPQGKKTPAVVIGFGADYAAAVHRQAGTSSGEPHWLEETLRDKLPGFAQRILEKTRDYAEANADVSAVAARWPTLPKTGAGPHRGSTSSGPRGGRR